MGRCGCDEGGSCVGEIRWRAGGLTFALGFYQHQPTIGFPGRINQPVAMVYTYIYTCITLIKLCYHIPKPNSVSLANGAKLEIWRFLEMLQSGAFGNLEIPEKMELVIFFLKETLGHLNIESDGTPQIFER